MWISGLSTESCSQLGLDSIPWWSWSRTALSQKIHSDHDSDFFYQYPDVSLLSALNNEKHRLFGGGEPKSRHRKMVKFCLLPLFKNSPLIKTSPERRVLYLEFVASTACECAHRAEVDPSVLYGGTSPPLWRDAQSQPKIRPSDWGGTSEAWRCFKE